MPQRIRAYFAFTFAEDKNRTVLRTLNCSKTVFKHFQLQSFLRCVYMCVSMSVCAKCWQELHMLHAGQVQHSIRIRYGLGDMGVPQAAARTRPKCPTEIGTRSRFLRAGEAHKLKLSVCPWHMTCPAAGRR